MATNRAQRLSLILYVIALQCNAFPILGGRKETVVSPPSLSIQLMHNKKRTSKNNNNRCRQLAMANNILEDEDDAPAEFIAEDFGVGEKTIGMRDLTQNQAGDLDAVTEQSSLSVVSAQTTPSLSPKTVLRFIAPTLALWIAPPIMSLIDTSAVGRFCGPTDLAGT
jgi:hypothetical protein